MPGGIRTILPSQGGEQEGEVEKVLVEEGSEGMVGNNNEGDSEESVEEEGGQEQERQEEQEEVPREVQGGMELLEREDSEEDIVVEEADENGVEETYKNINRELETMVEKVVDGQRISFRCTFKQTLHLATVFPLC